MVGGSLSEALGGIRNALLANALLLALGGLACAAAPSLGFLLAGRALCGFGIGVGGALVPLFIGQAAFGDPRSGMLGALNQVRPRTIVAILACVWFGSLCTSRER